MQARYDEMESFAVDSTKKMEVITREVRKLNSKIKLELSEEDMGRLTDGEDKILNRRMYHYRVSWPSVFQTSFPYCLMPGTNTFKFYSFVSIP